MVKNVPLQRIAYDLDMAMAVILKAKEEAREGKSNLSRAANALNRAKKAVLKAKNEGPPVALQQVADVLDAATRDLLGAKDEARAAGYVSPLDGLDFALTAETLPAVREAGELVLSVIEDLQRLVDRPLSHDPHHAGGALDNIAKRLNKLLIFMIAVSEDWESWSPEEREPLLLNIAARLDGWCCHADTAKGTRCQNNTTWPYDRCYAHLAESDKARHDAEQQQDNAERTRRDYLKELDKDEKAGRADDLAREKRQKAHEEKQPKRAADSDKWIVEELDRELEDQHDQRRQEEEDGLRPPEEELPEEELPEDADLVWPEDIVE